VTVLRRRDENRNENRHSLCLYVSPLYTLTRYPVSKLYRVYGELSLVLTSLYKSFACKVPSSNDKCALHYLLDRDLLSFVVFLPCRHTAKHHLVVEDKLFVEFLWRTISFWWWFLNNTPRRFILSIFSGKRQWKFTTDYG